MCSIPASHRHSVSLAAGDVITSVNGKTPASAEALSRLLEPYHRSDRLTIGWTNPIGQTQTSSVHLSSGPPE